MTEQLATLPRYEAYKDSGVEWIEEIPKHWEVKKLKFEDRTNMGQSPNSEDCNVEQKGIPFLQGNAEFGKLNPSPSIWCTKPKKIAEKGDILLSVRAPVGAINIADQRLGIGRGLTAITPGTSNISFKLYQLNGASVALNRLSTGSTFDAVSGGDVNNLFLPVPPISEQNNIANFLDQKTTQIDQAIAIKEKQITLLKERKQILIQNAVFRGLNSNAPMRDSGVEWIGEIPEHWGIKPGLCFFSENKRKNKGMIEDQVLSLSYGNIIIKPKEKLVGLVPESFETYQIVELGDIIIRCTDLQNDQTSLRTGIAVDRGIITSAYLNLKVANNQNPEFLHYYLHAIDITKVIYKYGSGLRQNLSFFDFKRMPVTNVPLEEQSSIVSHIKTESEKINNTVAIQQQQIEKLKEYKTTLINSAVTGKIKVA